MIDLHSHSTFSDGKLTPTQLVEHAHQHGITLLALTDHDTIDGIEQANEAAKNAAITLIPGVEFTVSWHKHILHVIGLQIDISNQSLLTRLEQQRQIRESRAIKIGEQLETVGIIAAYQGARALAGNRNIARPHFAQFLIVQGYAKDMQTAFKRYLGPGTVGYVHSSWPQLEAIVALIKASGGCSVLAHPLRYKLTVTKLRELVENFRQCGGEALEVISGMQNIAEINQLASLCKAYDLLASVGSDFHGENMTRVVMGKLASLPISCTPVWHNWADGAH